MSTNETAYPIAVQAVVIDLDGTLLDTAPDLAEAANRMLAEMQRPQVAMEVVNTYIGNGVDRLIKRVLTGEMYAEPDPQLFARAKPIYDRHYLAGVSRYSRPFPGVVEGLEALKRTGYRLACITNKAEKFTLPLLKDTGLFDYFELILSGDSLPRTKPDPLPLLHACEKFGVSPEHMLLIGDSQNDALAARAAGCHIFCVPYGYNHGEPVDQLDLDRVVESVFEASTLIRKA
ncbi:phosphoglycolate phosphatase, chromosomal [mine drainage metagenome]|uniref:phosphoglycolate phosphatase n=1 Tax=mine drainage metagenome TaxID=410659 RepID=A0A1J5QDF2_9ZZZZ